MPIASVATAIATPACACFSRMPSLSVMGFAFTLGAVATTVVLISHQRLNRLITSLCRSRSVMLVPRRPVDPGAARDAVVVVAGVGEGGGAVAPGARGEARQRPFPAADGVVPLAERLPGAAPVAPDAVDQVAGEADPAVGAFAQGERGIVAL